MSEYKLEKSLVALLECEKYYEFEQKVKSFGLRRIARKKYAEFDGLLQTSIRKLLQAKEGALILDLGELYLTYCKELNNQFEPAFEKFILLIFSNGEPQKRIIFLEKAIQATEGRFKSFHAFLGMAFIESKDFDKAYKSFLSCQNLPKLKLVLDLLIKCGNKSETDLLIVRAVFELVLKKELIKAKYFLNLYSDLERTPLLNFANFMLDSLKNENRDCFQHLLGTYKPSIERDRNLIQFLNKISIKYFDEPIIQPSGMQTLMKSMMSMFSTES